MFKTLLLTLPIIAISFVLLAITIIIKKNGKFPNIHIGGNKNMRKRGIKCAKEDEMKLWGKKNPDGTPACDEGGCSSCGADCK